MLATAPKAGTEVIVGTTVRVNFISRTSGSQYRTSRHPFESAQSVLQGVGFAVSRQNVEDDADAGIVVGQSPAA